MMVLNSPDARHRFFLLKPVVAAAVAVILSNVPIELRSFPSRLSTPYSISLSLTPFSSAPLLFLALVDLFLGAGVDLCSALAASMEQGPRVL